MTLARTCRSPRTYLLALIATLSPLGAVGQTSADLAQEQRSPFSIEASAALTTDFETKSPAFGVGLTAYRVVTLVMEWEQVHEPEGWNAYTHWPGSKGEYWTLACRLTPLKKWRLSPYLLVGSTWYSGHWYDGRNLPPWLSNHGYSPQEGLTQSSGPVLAIGADVRVADHVAAFVERRTALLMSNGDFGGSGSPFRAGLRLRFP